MIRVLRTYEVLCDGCDRRPVVVQASCEHDARKAAGLTTYASEGWGLTGYTNHQDLCPDCLAKIKAQP